MKTNLRKIIKEEVLKEDITSKCINTIINKPHTKACSVFNGRLGALCEKFNELEYQLSDESGLGMQSIIDNELDMLFKNL